MTPSTKGSRFSSRGRNVRVRFNREPGATSIHIHGVPKGATQGFGGMLAIHGLVTLLLIASLVHSGAWRTRSG